MDIKKLTDVLKTCELDKETKVQIIEIVTRASDPAMVDDFVNFLIEWDAADNAEEEAFLQKMKEIEQKFQSQMEEIDEGAEKKIEAIEENMATSDEAGSLKEQLKNE